MLLRQIVSPAQSLVRSKATEVSESPRTAHPSFIYSLLAMVVSIALAGAAQATTMPQYGFDFGVQSFEVQGNVAGDPRLDFNDGDPQVFTPRDVSSIADQEGGALHLRVLGSQDPVLFSQLNPGRVIRESMALGADDLNVVSGQGAFTATSIWETPPDIGNSGYSMGLTGNSGSSMQSISITLRDYSADFVTAPFAGGAGLVATIEHTTSTPQTSLVAGGPTRVFASFEQFALPIDRDSITGPIALRLSSDNAFGPYTAEISIDGGQTFQTIVESIVLGSPLRVGKFFLSAHEVISAGDDDPTTPVPEPSTALLMILGLIGISSAGRTQRA